MRAKPKKQTAWVAINLDFKYVEQNGRLIDRPDINTRIL